MYKIQTLNKIASCGLDLLDRDKYETASEFQHPDGIILRSFKMHDMELPETIKGIARAGAGVNNIPVEKYTEKGIVVFNTPGANANAVKELVLGALFLASRKITSGISWVQTQKDKADEIPKLVEKEKSRFAGQELKGKKLGIIGLGAIGVLVANAASELGMNVYGYDPFISIDAAWGLSRRVKKAVSLEQIVSECEYLSLHVPLNDKTRGIMNEEKFNLAEKPLKLLNFARGGLVNNSDLFKAIDAGKVASYITDFPEEDLLGRDEIITIPHLGASTAEAEENCAIMAVEQLKEFLETGNITNSVNFPECHLVQSGKTRLIVANKNVPNMLSQILTLLAEEGINVDDMINKHRNGIAYNIIDISSETIESETIEKIKSVSGIIMVRMIEK